MGRAAQSAFNGTPLDKLGSVDVYKETSSQLRNEFLSGLSGLGDYFQKALGSQNQLLGQLVSESFVNGKFDPRRAMDRLSSVLGASRSQVDRLSADLKENLLGKLGFSQPEAKQLRLLLDGAEYDLDKGNYQDTSVIVGLLEELTGKSNVFKLIDREAEAQVFSTVLGQVTQWGVPEAVDAVVDSIKDQRTRQIVVQRNANTIAQAGDIDIIESLIRKEGANVLTSQQPDLAVNVIRRYRFKRSLTPDQYPDRLTQLVNVLTALQPNWFIQQRGNHNVQSLAVLAYASSDARTLFLSSEVYRPHTLAARNYPRQSSKTIMREMYPYVGIVA